MKISVVTPCFRPGDWLKLCIASVADQTGCDVEHIIQDACSDDGTLDWLPKDPRVTAYVEKDKGMYDALNRGWKRSTGDIVAHLNCDEQYLPGALQAVAEHFETHPDTDVLLADTVVTDEKGDYLCHRISLTPMPHLIKVRHTALTCGIFFRRHLLTDHQLYFDTRWRDLGDLAWIVDACHRGLKFRELRRRVATFADTGENMNLRPNGIRETKIMADELPLWLKVAKPLVPWVNRVRLVAAGGLDRTPYDYALYTKESPDKRVVHHVEHPTSVWVGRSTLPVR